MSAVWAFLAWAWAFQAFLTLHLVLCVRRERIETACDPWEWDEK